MRFSLETKNGKPVIKAAGENPFVVEDLGSLHKTLKTQTNLDTKEVHWLGICYVLFATASLARTGNSLDRSNITKMLDAYYIPAVFNSSAIQIFEEGVNAGIESVRLAVLNKNEADVLNILATQLN